MSTTFIKDPDAVLDYQWDWAAWLETGETITAGTVTATSGLTIDSQTAATTDVTAWLSGGTAGQVYPVTCHVTTSAGRVDDRTILIHVEER